MRLTNRGFWNDYYHNDLDLVPWLLKPTSRRSREKGRLKRLAAKARRAEARATERLWMESL